MKTIIPVLQNVRKAAPSVRRLGDEQKKNLLNDLAEALLARQDEILRQNEKDLSRMDDSNPKKDRLRLTPERIEGLAQSMREVAELPDPTGILLSETTLENNLVVQKMAVPIGVVGIIYESRPNVTVDVAALCIRSGNAIVLRGGSDAEFSNKILVDIIHGVLKTHEVDTGALALLPTDREFVKELLTADQYVDILIPRGSQALIDFVRENASVPTIETGAGVCHTYVSSEADLEKAAAIVVNAKVSRPSVCNALDTILVDRKIADSFLPMIQEGMATYSVEVFADRDAYQILEKGNYPYLQAAQKEDFGREFLDYKCSIKVVENMVAALEHISTFSSRHSEAIVSENAGQCETFLQEVDAAAVYANASTRFTDGGIFGLGAEIGISTQKLHARGPFALEKLVTEKWIIRGEGQIR